VEGVRRIRETTWPGVLQPFAIAGAQHYFQLPDWDCYVQSGKSITFLMPDEPWNHLRDIRRGVGKMELLKADAANDGPGESVLSERPQGRKRLFTILRKPINGHKSVSPTLSRRNRWRTRGLQCHRWPRPEGSVKLCLHGFTATVPTNTALLRS